MCARRIPIWLFRRGGYHPPAAPVLSPSRGLVPGRPAGNVRNGGWGTFPPSARSPGFRRGAQCAPAGCRATVIRRGGYQPPVFPVLSPSVGAGPRPARRECPETVAWGYFAAAAASSFCHDTKGTKRSLRGRGIPISPFGFPLKRPRGKWIFPLDSFFFAN